MSLDLPLSSPSSYSVPSRALRVLAPAKVNLHLRVGPPRADGFHSLLTWMCTVSLFDTLTIETSAARPGETVGGRGEASLSKSGFAGHGLNAASPPLDGRNDSTTVTPADAAAGAAGAVIALTCDLPDLPCDADNLVVRVARAWHQQQQQLHRRRHEELCHSGESAEGGRGEACGAAETAAAAAMAVRRNVGGQDGAEIARIAVALGKRIPVGAGLGGGSSDAARTLLALERILLPPDQRCAAEDLSAFAARFGSDLSFFILGDGSAICRGRGEQVTPIAPPGARWAVLILPNESMPTPAVYRKFDEMRLGRSEHVEREPDWKAWVEMPAKYLLGCLVNDLEAPAFAISPSLGALRGDAEQFLGRPLRMSGSGSSLFTLYDTEGEARPAAELAAARFGQRVECVELAAEFADDLNGSVA